MDFKDTFFYFIFFIWSIDIKSGQMGKKVILLRSINLNIG